MQVGSPIAFVHKSKWKSHEIEIWNFCDVILSHVKR